MSVLRALVLALAVAVFALALAAVVAFYPPFQTWAARRALERRMGPGATLGRVDARLGAVDVVDLRIEENGAVLRVPLLHAELPTIAALYDRRLAISRLVGAGWTLDLSRFPGVRTPRRDPPGVPPGVPPARVARSAGLLLGAWFARLKLPFDLRLSGVSLEGDIVLPPAPGGAPAVVRTEVEGGGLAAGQEGRFVVRMATYGPPGAPIQSLDLEGELSADMDSPRSFSRLGLRMNAAAFGPRVPGGVRLIGDFGADRTPDGESYSAVISGETKPIAALLLTVPSGGGRPEGSWSVNVADEDLSPFALGRVLPEFVVAGQGRFDCDPAGLALHVVGGIDGTFERLGTFAPALAPVGTVRLTGDFDVTRSGTVWRIDRVSAMVQGTAPILSAHSLQAFGIDTATAELNVAHAQEPLFGIELQAVPVSWLRALFPAASIAGGPIAGELTATARAGRLSVRSTKAVAAEGISIGANGRPWIAGLSVSCSLTADYTEAGWQVMLDDAKLSSAGVPLGDLRGRLARRGGRGQATMIEGRLTAELPAIAAEPAFRDGENGPLPVRGGALEADFRAGFSRSDAVEARLALSGVELTGAAGPEPSLTARVQAVFGPGPRVRFNMPVTIARSGRRTDLTIVGTGSFRSSGATWNGEIGGTALEIDDAAELAPLARALFARVSVPDARFSFDFGHVALGREAAANAAGRLAFFPGGLRLDGVSAQLPAGGRLRGNAELDTASGSGLVLKVAGGLEDWNPGPALRRLNPGQPPALQGSFTVQGNFTGRGATLGAAFRRLQGSCSVASKSGRFRLLSTVIAPKGSGEGAFGALLDRVGDLFLRRKADFANPAEAAVYLAKAASDISYDQLSLTLVRGADLDTRVKDFALISPELRLEGGGRIVHHSGMPFVSQPLEASFRLSARGRSLAALKRLGALDPKPDALGYGRFAAPIEIRGSLEHPDTGQFRQVLLKLASGSGGLFGRLFGK